VAAVVDLLVMRTSSTTRRVSVPLKPRPRVSSGLADKSPPEDIMSAGIVDQCRVIEKMDKPGDFALSTLLARCQP